MTARRPETHCPKCDGTDLYVSSIVEGGFLCHGCGYGFVDNRVPAPEQEKPEPREVAMGQRVMEMLEALEAIRTVVEMMPLSRGRSELENILEGLAQAAASRMADPSNYESRVPEPVTVLEWRECMAIDPAVKMVLTIARNMIERGDEVPPNMTMVLVFELERLQAVLDSTNEGEK
jgi:transposase-like protein